MAWLIPPPLRAVTVEGFFFPDVPLYLGKQTQENEEKQESFPNKSGILREVKTQERLFLRRTRLLGSKIQGNQEINNSRKGRKKKNRKNQEV